MNARKRATGAAEAVVASAMTVNALRPERLPYVACAEEEEDSHRQLGILQGNSSPFDASSRRGLDPIKLAYNPRKVEG